MSVSSRQDIEKVILDTLQAFPRIQVAILYGSTARDQVSPHSDVDLAVGCGFRLGWTEKRDLQIDLSLALDREVDLIDLEALEGLLWETLWSEGKFLLWRHDLVVRYAGKVQAFVEDVKPSLMAVIDDRLEKAFGPL